ncbi:MAG: PKD domain-containing protein [Bacteroidetes bacterium]|nr:PKD domain-containing protein [Bacteroidota bacterium]
MKCCKPQGVWLKLFLCLSITGGYLKCFAQLKADFTMDPPNGGCAPLSVNFFNTSTGTSASATYEWDFGNNSNKGYDKDAGSVYITAKSYTVTLTVKDGAQTSTIQKSFSVYKQPVVDFSFTITKGCAPIGIGFKASATPGDGSLSKYIWDFGDGNIDSSSNTPNVSHIFTSAASPPVSLTVVNSYGCYAIADKTGITVLPSITAAFSADKTTLCSPGDQVRFTNGSSGPGTLSYYWDLGDDDNVTDTSPIHAYTKKGTYTVSLIANSSEGCSDTLFQPGYINVANFSTNFDLPSTICTNALTSFTNKSTPEATSTTWTIDGIPGGYIGQTFNYGFTSPGTYTVKMINNYGACYDTADKEITVKPGPKLDGFMTDIIPACGAPVTVNFKDTSASSVKWDWNFGDGQTSNSKAPSYTYTTNGIFNVLLTATDAEGCVNKVSIPISITSPDINITKTGPDNGCPGFSMQFAVDKPGDVKSYQWIFGDGDTSTAVNPTHTFSGEGVYSVILHYTTQSDCKGQATYNPVTVYKKPVVDFSVDSVEICGNSKVTFNNLTPGNVTDWQWDFGDGSTGSGATSPTHQYNQEGEYDVTLIAGNGTCRDTVTQKGFLKVLPPFPAILSALQTCSSGEVIFSQDSIGNKATSMWWAFGDGKTEAIPPLQKSITHIYSTTGSYQAYLIAENGKCKIRDSVKVNLLMKQTPVLEATLTAICGSGDLKIKIAGLEKNPAFPDNNSNHYSISSWQYGDGTTFTPTYTAADNYFITEYNATITNLSNGQNNIRAIIIANSYPYCTDTTNYITLKIKGPKADFGYMQNGVCFKKPIIFKDQSVANDGIPVKKWEWNFMDGGTLYHSDEDYPVNGLIQHQYAEPGNYYPILKITDADGCVSVTPSYSSNYASVKGPKADFNYSPEKIFPNTTVYFYNTSNANNSNPQYNWTFGNGDKYNSYTPPLKTYTALGKDSITLIAKDINGCTDTAKKVLFIKDVAASFTHTEAYINNTTCPPVIVKFTNTSENAQKVFWNFGDGGTADNQNFPSHTYYKPGVYKIVLYGYGNSNYIDSAIEYITIKGPYAILKADTLSGCLNQNVTLSAAVKNASSYTWDFGDGNLKLTTDTFATHSYENAGIYAPALILKDGDGCSGTSELPDKIVIDSLAIHSIRKSPVHICDSAMVLFEPEVKSIAAEQLQKTLSYSWNFGTGRPDAVSQDNPASYFYNIPGIFNATVKIKSPYGCEKIASDSVTIIPTPKATINSLQAICEEDSVVFKGAADLQGDLQWRWDFKNGNHSNLQLPPAQWYEDAASEDIVLTADNAGCIDTTTKLLTVNPRPIVTLSPKQSVVCLGKSIELNAGGGKQYNWAPAHGLNPLNGATTIATPSDNITYYVTVKNEFNCIRVDSASVSVAKPFQIQIVPDTFVCIGNAVQLPVKGADNYEWINNIIGLNNTTSPNPMASPQINTTYTVVGNDQYHCFSDTKSVTVAVKPLPSVTAPNDMELLTGDVVTLPTTASKDVVQYNWIPADYLDCATCAAPVSTPRSNINYVVSVQTRFGCISADTVSIKLICAQGRVYIPNAFTPNGDRQNDIFYVKGKGIRSIKSMRVFNRWGEVVFQTFNCNIEDASKGWDGMYKDRMAEGATYVYYIEFICDTGEIFTRKGTITLIR